MRRNKNEISEIQKINYDVYLKHRSYLISQKHKSEERESNLLILLSTWIFSLFFAFSQFVSSFFYIYIIIIAQFFALLSLVLILFSLIFSKKSFDKEIIIHDISYKNDNYNENIEVPKNSNTKYLRLCLVFSRIFIIIAIIFWFLFYFLNINNMSWEDKKNFTQNNEPCIKTNEPASKPLPIVKKDK